MTPEIQAIASEIKCLVTDVDGVLTDGRVYFDANGEAVKAFNALDGQGLRMLVDHGFEVAVITGRKSKILEHRFYELGVKHLYQGRLDKLNAFQELMYAADVTFENTAYIGDDIPDLPLIKRVKMGVTVPNAHSYVQEQAQFTTGRRGGEGAVREVCDWILSAHGHLDKLYADYTG